MSFIDDKRNSILCSSYELSELDLFDIEMESYYISNMNSYINEVIVEGFEVIEESIIDNVKEKGSNLAKKVQELWKKFKAWVTNLVRVVTNLFRSGEKIVKKYGNQLKTNYAKKKNTLPVDTYIYKVNDGAIDTLNNKIVNDSNYRDKIAEMSQDSFNKSVVGCVRNDTKTNKLADIPIDTITNFLLNGKKVIKSINEMEKKVDKQFKEVINKLKSGDNKNNEEVARIKKVSSMSSKMFNSLIREIKTGIRSYTAIVRKLLNDKYKGEDGEIEEKDEEKNDDVKDYVKNAKNISDDLHKKNETLKSINNEKGVLDFDVKKEVEDNIEDIKKSMGHLNLSDSLIKKMAESAASMEYYDKLMSSSLFKALDKDDQEGYRKRQKEAEDKFNQIQKEFMDAVEAAEKKESGNQVDKEELKNMVNKFNDSKKIKGANNASGTKKYVEKQQQKMKGNNPSNPHNKKDWYKDEEKSIKVRFNMSDEQLKKFKSDQANNKLIGDIAAARHEASNLLSQIQNTSDDKQRKKLNDEREKLFDNKIRPLEDRLRMKTGLDHIIKDEDRKNKAIEANKNQSMKKVKRKEKERREYVQQSREKIRKGKKDWK